MKKKKRAGSAFESGGNDVGCQKSLGEGLKTLREKPCQTLGGDQGSGRGKDEGTNLDLVCKKEKPKRESLR